MTCSCCPQKSQPARFLAILIAKVCFELSRAHVLSPNAIGGRPPKDTTTKSRHLLMAHEQLMNCCNMCNCWQVRVGTADSDMSVAMEAHALYCHFNRSDSSFNKGQAHCVAPYMLTIPPAVLRTWDVCTCVRTCSLRALGLC